MVLSYPWTSLEQFGINHDIDPQLFYYSSGPVGPQLFKSPKFFIFFTIMVILLIISLAWSLSIVYYYTNLVYFSIYDILYFKNKKIIHRVLYRERTNPVH